MKHFTFILIITLSTCLGLFASEPSLAQPGFYVLEVKLNDSITTPVRMSIEQRNDSFVYTIHNDTETIILDPIIKQDTLILRFPVFNSEFVCYSFSDSSFSGTWNNYHKGPTYQLPFIAAIQTKPFPPKSKTPIGNWEVNFSPGTPDSTKAIAILYQSENNMLTGTFLTETGDYRYLEGKIQSNHFYLSCFDGSHAFHFTGILHPDSSISSAYFYSGKHWSEPWNAIKNNLFQLRNPNNLTYLKPTYDKLAFTFPDPDNNVVSLTDEKFKGKVIIVQLMGTWCPNCLDESIYFNSLYEKYHASGLEVIALAYEAKSEFSYASSRVKTLKQKLKANYTFLIAGTLNKQEAQKTLPMLNHIMSFPTSIIIDRKGKVRNIYTGFYGPGTGSNYIKYTEETDHLIQTLLKEP